MNKILQPQGWIEPSGYANGMVAKGQMVFIGGQIGWNHENRFESDDFLVQVRQALQNIVSILAEADAKPHHLVNMTWYFTNKQDYKQNLRALGEIYREIIGLHYPCMAAMEVSALIEDRAKIEIQAVAVIPEKQA